MEVFWNIPAIQKILLSINLDPPSSKKGFKEQVTGGRYQWTCPGRDGHFLSFYDLQIASFQYNAKETRASWSFLDVFPPKNRATEMTWHMQQFSNKYPKPCYTKSFWGQQNSAKFIYYLLHEGLEGGQQWKDTHSKPHSHFSQKVLSYCMIWNHKLFRALHKRHFEVKGKMQKTVTGLQEESNFQ